MAHRALIDGTSFEVSGGRALVSGVSSEVSKGKALISGVSHDIEFKEAVVEMYCFDTDYEIDSYFDYEWGYDIESVDPKVRVISTDNVPDPVVEHLYTHEDAQDVDSQIDGHYYVLKEGSVVQLILTHPARTYKYASEIRINGRTVMSTLKAKTLNYEYAVERPAWISFALEYEYVEEIDDYDVIYRIEVEEYDELPDIGDYYPR